MSLPNEVKQKMTSAVEHLKQELHGIRTGRANPSMVEGVNVEVYGTQMRLRDLASITAPEPRQLVIQPFDTQNTPIIGKAIEKANLGLNPIVDANLVRINIPAMDSALREKMVKLVREIREKEKVVIRNIRRDANEAVREQKKNNEITEDELKRHEKEIQDLTDRFCKEMDEIAATKETEVTTI